MGQETSAGGAGESRLAVVHDDIVQRLVALQRALRERDVGVARIHDVGGAVLEPISGRSAPALIDLTAAEAELAARISAQELKDRIDELERVLARIDTLVVELRARGPVSDGAVEGSLRSIEDALADAAPQPPEA